MKSTLLLFSILIQAALFAESLEPPLLRGSEDLLRSFHFSTSDSKKDIKKKDKTPVLWGGNTLTQEERLINGFQMKVFILGGGAYITHKKIQLSAREIEVIGDDALIGNLKGQVIVEDKENGATLIANKGVYDKMAGTISLENKPVLIHKKDGKTVRIHCDSIVRYLEEARTVLSGKVIVTSLDFRVFGEDAVYFEKEDRIDLSNEPFLFTDNRFLQGKTLSYFVKEGSIVLDGDASIYQVGFESEKKKLDDSRKKKSSDKQTIDEKNNTKEEKEKIRVVTIFSGDKLVHKNKTSTTEPSTFMNGHAFLFRPDSEFKADEIESKQNNKLVISRGKVTFLDKTNSYRMQGGFLEYNKEKGYSYLTENPQIFFLDEKTLEEKGNLSAVFIERFDDKKEAVARGNVEIITQSSKAQGEYATFFEEEDKLVLEGNPSLTRDNTKVSAGKIIIYPNEDKAILTDGLKVIGNDQKK
jgi:lipopolysaccharide export system protein LptA